MEEGRGGESNTRPVLTEKTETMAASGFMRGLRANAIALIGSDAQATRELFQLLDAGAASDYRFAKALLQGRKTLPWLRDWQEKRASDIFRKDVSLFL